MPTLQQQYNVPLYNPAVPVPQTGISSAPAPLALTGKMSSILNTAIPGFSGLTADATGIVKNLMGGLPSAGPAQRANAYFGTRSGMPGSDFIRNRGFDLYGKESEGYKQRGFDDFLKMLSGYSGTVAPTVGQTQQGDQFSQNLMQRQQENNQNVAGQNYDRLTKPNAANIRTKGLEDGTYYIDTLGRRSTTRPGATSW